MSENGESKVASPVGVVIISAEEYRKMIERLALLQNECESQTRRADKLDSMRDELTRCTESLRAQLSQERADKEMYQRLYFNKLAEKHEEGKVE